MQLVPAKVKIILEHFAAAGVHGINIEQNALKAQNNSLETGKYSKATRGVSAAYGRLTA